MASLSFDVPVQEPKYHTCWNSVKTFCDTVRKSTLINVMKLEEKNLKCLFVQMLMILCGFKSKSIFSECKFKPHNDQTKTVKLNCWFSAACGQSAAYSIII